VKLQGRIPVEPLDDDRLVRIERNIVAGAAERAELAHRSPRRLFAFSAAALAAVAAGVVGYALHPGAAPTTALTVSPPAALGAQTVAVSTDSQHSTLDIGDATITSDPATHFEVVRPDGGVTVELALGKVELSVKKRHDRPRFEVHAGDTHVVVVGTKFSVEYDGKNHVDVRVTEGIVRVERASDVAKVAAGNEWTSTGGLIALATPPTPTDAITIDDPKLRDHHATAPETQHIEPHGTGDGATTSVAAKHPVDPTHAMTYGDLKAAIRQVPVHVVIDAGTTDPQAAISFYVGNVAHSDDYGVKRKNLYSMAVVQHLKLGRDAEADHTLDSVVERRGGDEYAAGVWLRLRIRCLAAIDDRCRQVARQYLDDAPNGPGASVAQRIILE